MNTLSLPSLLVRFLQHSSVHQLLPLIDQGIITLDHLIKRKNGTNRTSEKGPFFKIKPENLNMLFPEPVFYSLVED
ncbi:MvaI/BcnI family restriction endonuclease [Psychrobacter cibarius]|uniref:MvaI/BcnI family restriction endonuclease n=1 Tax=Psychrobacter cibarius TaxID=282669 RepID=UPI00191B4BA7